MAELPGGATGILCKDYRGKEADRLVTRIDPGVVAMAGTLLAHEPYQIIRYSAIPPYA